MAAKKAATTAAAKGRAKGGGTTKALAAGKTPRKASGRGK